MVERHNVIRGAALKGVEVFDCEVVVLVPTEFETRPIIGYLFESGLVQEIVDLFLVYLQVRTIDGEFLLLKVSLLLYQIEQVVDGTRHNTIIVHGMTGWCHMMLVMLS